MTIPAWVADAVFYQIFPDRFANGDVSNDPFNVQPWGSPPTRKGFQGGDLEGIRQKLDYLQDLGFNAIYLNPIFLSPSNHRYDTVDYYRIDPKLGSMDDFRALIRDAHARNMRVMLDGVFNHCSRGFFAFSDVLENGTDSPYQQWFHVRRFPVRAYDPGKARNYEAWWGHKSMPKLNTSTPAVRRYLLDVARYWLDQGADGWRLDVPNEIDDDDFWSAFRQEVHAANPEAYLVGEIWDVWPRWVNDTHFDGLMNYPMRSAVLDLLNGRASAGQFSERVTALLAVYARENVFAMYNLLGSHDTERIMTLVRGDTRKAALAHLFLLAYPGVPSIYYGDEVGMHGGKDPDCRRAFPRNSDSWDETLQARIRGLIQARRASSALRLGTFSPLVSNNASGALAFARSHESQTVVIAMNAGAHTAELDIPLETFGYSEGQVLHGLEDGREERVMDGRLRLRLEPYQGTYLA